MSRLVVRSARLAEIARFVLVGGFAFVVDASLLEFFIHLTLDPWLARILSIGIALQVSYLLHARFTYRGHAGISRKSWRTFLTSNLLGSAINYGTFLTLLTLNLGNNAQTSRLIALLTATAIAMMFNYWANRRFAFTRESS